MFGPMRSAAAIPEFGWSIGDALFMPYLLQNHVPAQWLSIAWLLSPLLGVVLHPGLGRLRIGSSINRKCNEMIGKASYSGSREN